MPTKSPARQSASIYASPLFRRFLIPILLTMTGFAAAVYFAAVPMIRDIVYALEEKSVETNLTNILSLIESNYSATEAYKKSVIDAHKRELKNIILFTEAYLKTKVQQVADGIISEDQAQWSALEELRNFRYGKNDYIWVADYNGYFLEHPDPKMNMEDFSQVRDVFGNYILTPLIQKAMEKEEGYHRYWWQRLDSDLPAEVLAYARLFPDWEWVIGTGAFIDDLETEILVRKEKMIDELRSILKPITIGKTGYMYIFDSWQNIIIHPNAELENTDMSKWINPVTGNPLVKDLIAVSKTESHELHYKWNRPDDPDHYIYDRIAWVRHVKGFDWYIVAEVYPDELNATSNHLRDQLLILTAVVIGLSVVIVSIMMGRLLLPIRKLANVAGQVEEGDLEAQSDIDSRDEIGVLARAFNSMVRRLRTYIEELDSKVLERTTELNRANEHLTRVVERLEQSNREITQLNVMAERLQACDSLDETYPVVADCLAALFPEAWGGLYMAETGDDDEELMVPVIFWGERPPTADDTAISAESCLALKDYKITLAQRPGEDEICNHIYPGSRHVSLCMPLFGQSNVLGLIYLEFGEETAGNDEEIANWQRLATAVTDQLSMAMANLRLRDRLQKLSVRDGLTGLFNRRYMEETLQREFTAADRTGRPVGVIILDVDFFKKFNDTYGHEAGDLVLKELAKKLTSCVRKSDVVCRYGGEEFVVIFPGPPEDRALERAEVIRAAVDNEMRIRYHENVFHVTISLGVAVYPRHGKTPEEVLKAADTALYRAKEQGRNQAVAA